MSNAIEINKVTKLFGRKEVLINVSFTVPQGVVFALLGENGAGKSTLIRGMMGYHKMTYGQISVCGLDPTKSPLEIRRQVGYVSDAPGLYEWMTVAEVGWYAAGFYNEAFLKNYHRLTEEYSLPLDAKIRDLSKGMRAKIALSLAIAPDPAVLVLDEPTSGLDPAVRRSFLESMIDRAANGQTVFLSSHQIHEVERVADWVAILHAGQLQIVAPLEDLKTTLTLLTYSQRDLLLAPPPELQQVDVLRKNQVGRTTQMLVRGLKDEHLDQLRSQPNLLEVHAIRPNLEELYLAFTQDGASSNDRGVPVLGTQVRPVTGDVA